jgi:hypothetical protein
VVGVGGYEGDAAGLGRRRGGFVGSGGGGDRRRVLEEGTLTWTETGKS